MTQEEAMPSRPDGKVEVTIKGTRKGLSITLGDGDWSQLLRELDANLYQANTLFQGSRVHLHTGKRDVGLQDMRDLMRVLESHDIELVSLQTDSTVTAETAQALQVKLALAEVAGVIAGMRVPLEQELNEGVLIRRTLRSGQSIRHRGHVLVIGDVNPGAEIIAGGDVVVWGRLRGTVHAGAAGDDKAIVCALELIPTQLRIGIHIAIPPDEKQSRLSLPGRSQGKQPRRGGVIRPEIASVVNGRIVVELWSNK